MRSTEKEHITFYRREAMAEHPSGVKLHVFNAAGERLRETRYLPVGDGLVVTVGASNMQVLAAHNQLPRPFRSGKELLAVRESTGRFIARLMLESELTWRSETEVRVGLLDTWHVMQACAVRDCRMEGELPGPLRVRRRAAELYS